MARLVAADRRFLEEHRGKWRVVVPVPRELHKRLGTKLKKHLNTDSLAVANRLKWAVIGDLRQVIYDVLAKDGSTKDALTREALEIAALRARADADHDMLDEAIDRRGDELRGDPVRTEADPETGSPGYVYDPAREKRAGLYIAIARGEATPLRSHHDQYLAQSITKRRTKGDDSRAIAYLEQWCEQNHIRPTLQAITRKVAAQFRNEMHTVAVGRDDTTLNKYLGRLRQYWAWLVENQHLPDEPGNVWVGLKRKVADTPHDEKEREFTKEEMVKLLEGPAPSALRDVMLIGALTGARLDAIVDLRVKDCQGGAFTFKPQKREKKPRDVPIHSALKGLVKGRVKGKKPTDHIFPEWPAPQSGSQRERSFKTSNAFTEYRRSVGVDDQVEGKRRSRVNFHSFRRWFITRAEQADQPPHIIATVVGQKRPGETLGRYSAGPQMEQLRRCVEAVKLPRHRRPKQTA